LINLEVGGKIIETTIGDLYNNLSRKETTWKYYINLNRIKLLNETPRYCSS
jgi:hypothetical protein